MIPALLHKYMEGYFLSSYDYGLNTEHQVWWKASIFLFRMVRRRGKVAPDIIRLIRMHIKTSSHNLQDMFYNSE